MRWLLIPAAAFLGLCGVAEAREPLARPMEQTPSIMVTDEVEEPRATKRRSGVRRQTTRARRTQVTRPVVVPRTSSIYEAQGRSINSSINQRLQSQQFQQSIQTQSNFIRGDIQRGVGSSIGSRY